MLGLADAMGWRPPDLYRASMFELTSIVAARMRRNREADEARRKPALNDNQIDAYFLTRNKALEKMGFKHCA